MRNKRRMRWPARACLLLFTAFLAAGCGRENDAEAGNGKAESGYAAPHDPSSPFDFWKRLSAAISANDRETLRELSAFPFLIQNEYIAESDFGRFELSNELIEEAGKAVPQPSSMFFGGGMMGDQTVDAPPYEEGSMYEADIGGPALYFAKVKGEYRLLGILYGE